MKTLIVQEGHHNRQIDQLIRKVFQFQVMYHQKHQVVYLPIRGNKNKIPHHLQPGST